ncbi:MAG TPA: hypothetical protein PLZ94_15585, partial [Armatimonadota bacterium]|nr:hypothetical protein [Armatimonadota bacterium]
RIIPSLLPTTTVCYDSRRTGGCQQRIGKEEDRRLLGILIASDTLLPRAGVRACHRFFGKEGSPC